MTKQFPCLFTHGVIVAAALTWRGSGLTAINQLQLLSTCHLVDGPWEFKTLASISCILD